MKPQISISTPILLVLACFVISRTAQGVVPAPDGWYANYNTAEGQNALLSLSTGIDNTAIGWSSLRSDTTGGYNTGLGAGTLFANTASGNTAIGAAALFKNTTGSSNAATGLVTLYNNTTGTNNTANGTFALFGNTIGSNNTASGRSALTNNTVGNGNTGHGVNALVSNTAGDANTAVGVDALVQNVTGSLNTALGFSAGSNVTTADNVICIGADVEGFNVSNSCFIGNIRGAPVGGDALPVLIDSTGKLGTMTSSRRFKRAIKPMDKTSDAILALKPVTFQYKSDRKGTPQFGLIAEEVAAVDPDLVVRDKNGEIYTVRYDAVNAMLLNEFLKEHRKVEKQDRKLREQEAAIAKHEGAIAQLKQSFHTRLATQQKQIEALASGLQKVSDQLEPGKPSPHLVLDDH